MDKEQIIQAGEQATALARRVADLLIASDVPPAHWDEVLERVTEILSQQPDAQGREGQPAE